MLPFVASLWGWTLIVSLLSLMVYFIGTWSYDHFSKRNVPFLKPVPFLGNMGPMAFKKVSFPDFVSDVYNRLKGHRCGGIFDFLKPVLVLRDPELIKLVTVKDFDYFLDHRAVFTEENDPVFGRGLFGLQGMKWKHMRSTLSPAFTSSKMKSMFVLVSQCGDQLGDFLHQCIHDKSMKIEDTKIERHGNILEVEMKDLFTRYTNDVITTAALGIGCDSLKNPKNEFYTLGKKLTTFDTVTQLKFFGISFSPALMRMLNITLFPKKLTDYFRSLILNTIEIRENKGIIRPDMIQLLMQARKGTLKSEENGTINGTTVKSKLEDDDIVAQAMLFFFAGFETVSVLMCFSSLLLAQYPDIQLRLQKEIDQTLNENDGKLTYEALHAMKYLDMVLSETLRLYSPAVFTDRLCVRKYTLPTEPPYTLNPGEGVWIPVQGLHHDPQYFPDPEKFDPERFSDENKDKITPYTYLPFGSGPRNCIGNRFALMETKIALSHMLSRFNFKVISRTPIPIKVSRKGFNITVDGGFWLGLEERS